MLIIDLLLEGSMWRYSQIILRKKGNNKQEKIYIYMGRKGVWIREWQMLKRIGKMLMAKSGKEYLRVLLEFL